jgi:TolB-like protein
MKRILVVFFALFAPLVAPLHAQDARLVVAVLPFQAVGVSAEETKTIENLVQSYVSELQEFRLIASADRDRILREQEFSAAVSESARIGDLLSANFLLSGNLGAISDERVLTLQVVKVLTGEKRSVSLTNRNMSELALATRSLVLRALDKADETASTEAAKQEVLVEDIIGSWRGDKGIELVRIFRGSKAVAVFSSGVQMELSYRIEGADLSFLQTSPNSPRYYYPVPYTVAQELAKTAQPMEWRFRLYSGAAALRGTKLSTSVTYEKDRILEIAHDASRVAEWTKATR